MSALGPKKKNLFIIMAAIVAAAVVISVVLDIMTNNGGHIILVGAIAGVVVAAAVFLVFNFISKKDGSNTAFDDESRFTRKRRNSDDMFDNSAFDDGFETSEDAFSAFDNVGSEPEFEENSNNAGRFSLPSEQLREKGFFGRKRETVETPAEEIAEEPDAWDEPETWNEPEYEGDFDSEYYEEDTDSEEFNDMEFEAPVIAFGNPVPEETEEAPVYDEVEEFEVEEPAENPEEIASEPEYEETQYAEIENVTESEADNEPEVQNSLLLKDIPADMVVASRAPGQTLESLYADMSEEDIIYRDCVEVWSSAAKNPMMKILEKLKSIDDKKVAGELGRDCEYVNAMIDRMLYFTQLEMIDQALNMQVYNYSVLVKECLKRFSPFFTEKKISLLWKGLDVDIITDKRWFIFAMTQVIFNSIEFTPHGGKIAVSAKKTDDYVDLIIDDSGEGMDAEELPYAFTAGFMGDEAPNPDETRTGMGLFITRSVLQKMGGECMAQSTKGKGMRIVIRLPAIKEESQN